MIFNQLGASFEAMPFCIKLYKSKITNAWRYFHEHSYQNIRKTALTKYVDGGLIEVVY